jgi:hypothetical protein
VISEGSPLMVKATPPLKPLDPTTLTETDPDVAPAMLSAELESDKLKFPAGGGGPAVLELPPPHPASKPAVRSDSAKCEAIRQKREESRMALSTNTSTPRTESVRQ